MRGSGYRSREERVVLVAGGIVIAIVIGLGLLWLGFVLGQRSASPQPGPTATATIQPLPTTTPVNIVALSTNTPLPTATSLPSPTQILPTDTQAPPMLVAGENGLNIRSGPGTNFSVLAHVDPGTQLLITGRYADWWQVDYGSSPGWAADWVVNAINADGVPEVVPPASPIPPPPTAVPTKTSIPATSTPAATPKPDTRGLVVNSFTIDNAPGPYGNGGDVWFNIDLTNTNAQTIVIDKLGAWVEENGQFKVSWGVADPLKIEGGKSFQWRDHLRSDNMPAVGTYHVWLRACFEDGYCVNMAGPIKVKIG